jgi:threonine dehydrogenase-like Zn-dependent dehydrogenase
MDAVVLRRGADRPSVMEMPRPEPGPGEVLVETLRVGVDGTDMEVVSGAHGGFPEGEDHLVLGHEAVGIVVDANGTHIEEGTVVAPTVRRPPPGGETEQFRLGQPDMAPLDEAVERGISGAHGFMAEYFTSPADCLVPVPDDLAEWGFLVEPISITEKAMDHSRASRSAFDWRPESALVLGNGPLGLLTLAMYEADDEFERTYCLGRRDRPDPTIDLVERLGGTYVDSRETPVETIPDTHESMDLVYEATGYAKHAFTGIQALAPNGVLALLGVPEPWEFEIDGGSIHRDVVLNNKAVVGSVNAGMHHFEAAVETLGDLPTWFLEDLVTGIVPAADPLGAFETDDDATIKTAVEFRTP